MAAHYLSEPEEKLWEELANGGRRAFGRLFSEVSSRMKFTLRGAAAKMADGQARELTQSEVLALLYDPDRETRRAAAAAISEALAGEQHVLAFIFNTLLQEKAVSDRLRHYDSPEASRHLDNELQPEVVQHVVDVCVRNYDLVADYYQVKRRLLGLDDDVPGDIQTERSFVRFLTFVSFFPQLVAGPIERARNLLPQLQGEPQITREDIGDVL